MKWYPILGVFTLAIMVGANGGARRIRKKSYGKGL